MLKRPKRAADVVDNLTVEHAEANENLRLILDESERHRSSRPHVNTDHHVKRLVTESGHALARGLARSSITFDSANARRLWAEKVNSQYKTAIFQILKENHGNVLNYSFIEANFLYPGMQSLDLSGVPLNSGHLYSLIRLTGTTLTSIDLSSNLKLSDTVISKLIQTCSKSLQYLKLRSCASLTNAAMPTSVVKQLLHLQYLNISYTKMGIRVFDDIVKYCASIRTFKHTTLRISDKSLDSILSPSSPLPLTNLKLRFSDVVTVRGLNTILLTCPNLEHLDLSHGNIRSLSSLVPGTYKLTKLNLNYQNNDSSKIDNQSLLKLFCSAPRIQSLYLAKVPGMQSCFTLPEAMQGLKILFLPSSPAWNLFSKILRECRSLEYLDMARWTQTSAGSRFYLEAMKSGLLVSAEEGEDVTILPHLQVLNVEYNNVDDDDTLLFSRFKALRTLYLSHTKVTALGLRRMLYHCPDLRDVHLDGCRGIDVLDRRTIVHAIRQEIHHS